MLEQQRSQDRSLKTGARSGTGKERQGWLGQPDWALPVLKLGRRLACSKKGVPGCLGDAAEACVQRAADTAEYGCVMEIRIDGV